MSNTSERAVGAVKELGGKIKSAVGKAIGNTQMQAEGMAAERAGAAKQAAAKASERGKAMVEGVVGAVKERVGAAIGNEQMQVEGMAKSLVGEARKSANQ
jgi:uncharacterized protein YjbJ (UPF0337 family)